MFHELVGNGSIVTPSADLDLAVRGIVFSAAGTAGQRCTTLRRLIVHRSIADHGVAAHQRDRGVEELRARARDALRAVGADAEAGEPGGYGLPAGTPVTGDVLFTVAETSPDDADTAIAEAAQAFTPWRPTPAPARGAVVARLGELARRAQGGPRDSGHDRGREDHVGGRSARCRR